MREQAGHWGCTLPPLTSLSRALGNTGKTETQKNSQLLLSFSLSSERYMYPETDLWKDEA